MYEENKNDLIRDEVDNISDTSSNSTIFQAGLTDKEISESVDAIIEKNQSLIPHKELIYRGAVLANDGGSVLQEHQHHYTNAEVDQLVFESKHSIRAQSWTMFLVALSACLSAVNFGHDESAVSGAQLDYIKLFHITNANIQGTVNAAPYLAAGTLGIGFAILLDKYIGRKWIIFISCIFGVGGSLWQAFSQSMGSLLAARLFLGVGMGLNSSAVPLLIAEAAPAKSRGAFLMLWQTFVAFGVMLGSVFNRAFVDVEQIGWRLMIGASFVAPILTAALVVFIPESPRYLLSIHKDEQALISLVKLRNSELAGSRDFFVLYNSLKRSDEIEKIPITSQISLFFNNGRVKYAFLVSAFNMIMQQYCGVNILVGYTTTILVGSGVDPKTAIAGSIGIGGGCFLATFFSSQCIDRFGRRRMLLSTFPLLSGCLFWLGGSLYIFDDTSRLGSGLTAMYMFVIFFGLGIGPISWTYNAEVYPLNVRVLGVAIGMAINWILDFVLSMTWPKMAETMSPSGGLFFYAAFNLFAFFFTYFLIPETKELTLEELDNVFSQSPLKFAKTKALRFFKRN